MQVAVVEYARHVCSLDAASSVEFNEQTKEPVVIHMPEIDRTTMGATQRLGLRPTHFGQDTQWSKIRALYSEPSPPVTNGATNEPRANGTLEESLTNGATTCTPPPTPPSPLIINERHRHRYEVNPAYVDRLTKAGLHFIGKDDKEERMEILELKDHRWFVGVQFHPEYLSRVLKPSKPYLGFVAASAGVLQQVMLRGGRGRRGLVSLEEEGGEGGEGVGI